MRCGGGTRPRKGASAIELLVASAILAAAFVPIYTLVQGSQKAAYLNELNVLGRRRAWRALNHVRGYSYAQLTLASQGGAAPPDVPGLPPEGSEMMIPLPTGEQEKTLENAPGNMLESYVIRVDKMRVKVFFHELEPGLARLAGVARWVDPSSKKPRYYVALSYVEDPFHFRGVP